MYGGLYRKVWLVRTAAAHFDLLDHATSGVYVSPTNVTRCRCRARGAGAGAQRGLRGRGRARHAPLRRGRSRGGGRARAGAAGVRRVGRGHPEVARGCADLVDARGALPLPRAGRAVVGRRPAGPRGGAHRLPRFPLRAGAVPLERAAHPAAGRRQAPGDGGARRRGHRRRAARGLREPAGPGRELRPPRPLPARPAGVRPGGRAGHPGLGGERPLELREGGPRDRRDHHARDGPPELQPPVDRDVVRRQRDRLRPRRAASPQPRRPRIRSASSSMPATPACRGRSGSRTST